MCKTCQRSFLEESNAMPALGCLDLRVNQHHRPALNKDYSAICKGECLKSIKVGVFHYLPNYPAWLLDFFTNEGDN